MPSSIVALTLLLGSTEPTITLPQGGTVVFLGDSVTWQNDYVAWIELRARQRGRRDLTFVNLGVRGDTAARVRRRLDRDLVPIQPDVVFVMLGINDGGLAGQSGRLLDQYGREMSRLVDAIRKRTDATVVLLSPTCVDPARPGMKEYNGMLRHMVQRLAGVAAQYRVAMIDVFAPLQQALERSSEVGIALMADALHPNEAGHLVVAATILEHIEGMGSRTGQEIVISREVCEGGQQEVVIEPPSLGGWYPPAYAPLLRSVTATAFGSDRLRLTGHRCPLWFRVPPHVVSVGEKLREIELPLPEARRIWSPAMQRLRALLRARWQASYARWDPEQIGPERAFADVGGTLSPGTVDPERWLERRLVDVAAQLRSWTADAETGGPARRRILISGRPISL